MINEIARLRPEETWVLVTKYIEPPIDSRAFRICLWLRGGEFFAEAAGAVATMPRDKIWEWVNENVDKRASFGAHIAANDLAGQLVQQSGARSARTVRQP